MKAQLNSYLATNPNSSLNPFRDLYLNDLEKKANLELQKFSIDFNSLSDEQKGIFFKELDKALTNIQIMRDIVIDINKDIQMENTRAAYFEARAVEQLKEEEEEIKVRKSIESLNAAIEMAAPKTSGAINTGTVIPGLDSMVAVEQLTTQFVNDIKILDEQLIKVTEILLDKVKVVEDADSKLGDTGYMDEDGNMGKTSILVGAIRFQENANLLAQEFGIRPQEVHKLRVYGDRVVVDGVDKSIPFSDVEDLFRTSTKKNATLISPIMLGDTSGIRLAKEKAEMTSKYFDEKNTLIQQGVDETFKWRMAILKDMGIIVDEARIAEQLVEVERNAPVSFVEKLAQVNAMTKVLERELEELDTAKKAHSNHPQTQILDVFEQIRRGNYKLKKVEEIDDRSSVDLSTYKNKPLKFADDIIPKNPGIKPDEVHITRPYDGPTPTRGSGLK